MPAALARASRPGRTGGDDAAIVPATTRRLLLGWLALAVGSLVVAGLFAALAAFARTPAVRLLSSAPAFHLALTTHVTFAFTVWFASFAGALWVYAAWRANAPLARRPSWIALGLATAGAGLLAVPAVLGTGRPYLNDYVPVVDHPAFWAGLGLTALGLELQATAYLAAFVRSCARAAPVPPEAAAMAVGGLAALLALAAAALAAGGLDAALPLGYRLRALFWGPGHLMQFLHVAGMAAAWFVATAVAVGAPLPAGRARAILLWGLAPFMVATVVAYLVWRPEALLGNHLVTVLSFGGLGAVAGPLALMTVTAWRPSRAGRLPWASPLFSGSALSIALFAVGGVLGVAGFGQDTRVPAHYHGMVGAVTLAYMGLAPMLLEICGRRPWSARLARWQPYLYGLGLLGLMAGLHWAGGRGAPRKALGFNWADAQALAAMNVMGLGSLLAILGGLAFVLNVGLPLVRRRERQP
jgi:hypothetical protein